MSEPAVPDVPDAPDAPPMAEIDESCPLWKVAVLVRINAAVYDQPVFCPYGVNVTVYCRNGTTGQISTKVTRVTTNAPPVPEVEVDGEEARTTCDVWLEAAAPFEQWKSRSVNYVVERGTTRHVEIELAPVSLDASDPMPANAIDNGMWRGRPFWFNYFWNEGRDKKEKAAMVSAAVFTPQRTLKVTAAQWTNDEWRRAMKLLLDLGFNKMNDAAVQQWRVTAAQAGLPSIRRADGARVYLVYRSDTRGVDDLRERGFERQTVNPRAGVIHADSAWNPFSQINDDVYLRMKTVDNCLYSAVSVSTRPDACTEFPKLQDAANYSQLDGVAFPSGVWTDAQKTGRAQQMTQAADRAVTFGDFAILDGNGAIQVATLPITRTNMYLIGLAANDAVFDTEAFQRAKKGGGQQGFPERGLHSVPFARFIAVLRFLRVHHDTGGERGLTFFLDEGGATPLVPLNTLNRADYDAEIARLRAPNVLSLTNDQNERDGWLYGLGPIAPAQAVQAAARMKADWPSRMRIPIALDGLAKDWVKRWLASGFRVYGRLLSGDGGEHIGFDVDRMDGDNVQVVTSKVFQQAPAAGLFQRTAAFFRNPLR